MLVPMTKETSVSCISLQDPAIDSERVERDVLRDGEGNALTDQPVAVYLRDRLRDPASWRRTVPMKDGATPTEFVIGVVPPAELNRIEDECQARKGETRTNELAWRCFLHGVRKVEGLGVEVVYTEVNGVKYVSPQWLADVFVGPLRNVALEIGTVIWHWNQLSPADVGN